MAVCAGVLLLLARMRFPDAAPVEVSAPPLERLAARASYDALAADVQRAEQTVRRSVVTLRVSQRRRINPYSIWDAIDGSAAPGAVRHVVAMRTSADTALAPIGTESRIEGIAGEDAGAAPAVLGMDPIRGWALVRVPATAEPLPQIRPLSSLPTHTYVVVAEGTQAGATLRPMFLGQGTRFDSVKWERPLLPLGVISISPGALLFTLDGEFIGATADDGGAPAIVGARDLFDVATRLTADPHGAIGDIGVTVQRLTVELAIASQTNRGVMVAEVDSDGPASTLLEPGDVITMLDGRPVADPGDFLLEVAKRNVDSTVTVSFIRAGEAGTATLTVRAASAAVETEPVSFAREAGLGTRIESGGKENVSGLHPGDIVVRAGATIAPTPAQLRAFLARPSETGFVTLVVRRDGRQQVIGVRGAGGSDATTR